MNRSITIRFQEEEKGWRILWSDTGEPASERLFKTIHEASRKGHELMGGKGFPYLDYLTPDSCEIRTRSSIVDAAHQ